MCGIVAYIGNKNAAEVILDGLTKLEYRGYDSAGIAVLENGKIEVLRSVGKLTNLRQLLLSKQLKATLGIGHTRWATHGKPTFENAHPHSSRGVSLVHNGIIENYVELKNMLIQKGYVFNSETDTEVIAHLIHSNLMGSIIEAVHKSLSSLKGSYALAVIYEKEPDKIVLARHDSPLVIGKSEKESMAASDIPALLSYTRDFIFLEDDDIAVLTKTDIKIYNHQMNEETRDIHHIDWNPVMAEKSGFKHFMKKEIYEQPRAIIDTSRGKSSPEDGKILLPEFDSINFNKISRIHIVACGTSWHAGLVGKFYVEKFARIPVEVDIASEYRYRDNIINENTLFIGISQSGETADTLAALRIAKKSGAKIVSICNVLGSTITRESDAVFYTHAGPEIGVASTKAFTTQLSALLMLALYMAQKKNTIDNNQLRSYIQNLVEIPEKISEVLKQDEYIEDISKRFKDDKDFLYLGRNVNYPIALEGALKLKEISYIHAEGYPAGEMKHGPIALIDKNMPVLVIATKSSVYQKILSNVQEVKARDGIVISVVTKDDSEIAKNSDFAIEIPETMEELSPFLNAVVVQFIAYHIASHLGLDVDHPRNLAKSVTVE